MTLWEHETLQSIFIPLPRVTLFAFVTLGIITRFPQVFKNSSNTTDNLLRSSYNAFNNPIRSQMEIIEKIHMLRDILDLSTKEYKKSSISTHNFN